jgi:hypothetical protein
VRDSIDGSEHEQNSDADDHAHRYNLGLPHAAFRAVEPKRTDRTGRKCR